MTKAYYSVKDWSVLAKEMDKNELGEIIEIFESAKREKERLDSFVESGPNSMKSGKTRLRRGRF